MRCRPPSSACCCPSWTRGATDAGRRPTPMRMPGTVSPLNARAGIAQYVNAPVVDEGVKPAWHLYVATHERADELIAGLGERGIEARSYYRTPLHRQKAMAPYAPADEHALPVTDELARKNLALPM